MHSYFVGKRTKFWVEASSSWLLCASSQGICETDICAGSSEPSLLTYSSSTRISRAGPEVLKKISCSTQLSIKFEKDIYFLLFSSHMMNLSC